MLQNINNVRLFGGCFDGRKFIWLPWLDSNNNYLRNMKVKEALPNVPVV